MGQSQSVVKPLPSIDPNLPTKTIHGKRGTTYIGQVNSKNQKHGYGQLIWPGKLEYNGQFKNGHIHGYGEMKHTNGTEYEGEYKFDKYHGRGKLKYSNWQIYEGKFKNGLRHGHGILYNSDGTVRRRGQWKYDKASHCCGLC